MPFGAREPVFTIDQPEVLEPLTRGQLLARGLNPDDGSLLDVFVSPGNGSAGGLEIGGNVVGTTAVRFTSDGTDATVRKLRIIDSPNDTLGDGGFIAADAQADGMVRLEGTPWLQTSLPPCPAARRPKAPARTTRSSPAG